MLVRGAPSIMSMVLVEGECMRSLLLINLEVQKTHKRVLLRGVPQRSLLRYARLCRRTDYREFVETEVFASSFDDGVEGTIRVGFK